MDSFVPVPYDNSYQHELYVFLEKCLPESGRAFDLQGRHSFYQDISQYFRAFWCMFDGDQIIGTVAVKELSKHNCELKSLYLLEKYHGRGLGRVLLETAIAFAKENGYQKIYLDSLSTSTNALALYRKTGFTDTARYNDNPRSDIFMVLNLSEQDDK